MNSSLKSVITGLCIGLAPLVVCALLFYVTPYLIEGNAGSLLSFAVMALFVVSSIAVLVVSIIMLARKQMITGITSLIVLCAEFIAMILFLA